MSGPAWYTRADGTPVVWADDVIAGRAVRELRRTTLYAGSRPLTEVWRAPGDVVTDTAATTAQTEQSVDPVPTPDPPTTSSGGRRLFPTA